MDVFHKAVIRLLIACVACVALTTVFMVCSDSCGQDETSAQTADQTLNSGIPVPMWQWVDPVSSPSDEDMCGIAWGGHVVVVNAGDKASLVKYRTSDERGTNCDNNTMFMIKNSELARWPKLAKMRALTEKLEKEAVEQAVKNPDIRQRFMAVTRWEWVDVKNVTPLKNANITYSYGNLCGIEAGGSLRVIGYFQNMHRIVRYQSPPGPQRGGTTCPNGTISFIMENIP